MYFWTHRKTPLLRLGSRGPAVQIRPSRPVIARIIHETVSRDRADGRATGQPQGIGSEAYLESTSQDTITEDARKDGHIRGRSRRFVNSAGWVKGPTDSVGPFLLPRGKR